MFLARKDLILARLWVASLGSPQVLVLNWYLHFRLQKQNWQGEAQAHLISAASVSVPVNVVPLDVFAFPLTSPLEPLAIVFALVHFASPICRGLNSESEPSQHCNDPTKELQFQNENAGRKPYRCSKFFPSDHRGLLQRSTNAFARYSTPQLLGLDL